MQFLHTFGFSSGRSLDIDLPKKSPKRHDCLGYSAGRTAKNSALITALSTFPRTSGFGSYAEFNPSPPFEGRGVPRRLQSEHAFQHTLSCNEPKGAAHGAVTGIHRTARRTPKPGQTQTLRSTAAITLVRIDAGKSLIAASPDGSDKTAASPRVSADHTEYCGGN